MTIMSVFMERTCACHPGVFACGCCVLYQVCRWWVRLSLELAERIVGIYPLAPRLRPSVSGWRGSHFMLIILFVKYTMYQGSLLLCFWCC
jgi:hypothetical protein